MSRALNDLAPVFKPLAMELLARCVEQQIPVLIVNTRRTAAEQAINIANGTSQVRHSKHEDGLAIDICPYTQWMEFGSDKLAWNTDDPQWAKIGAIVESLGLRWGGRFVTLKDVGHAEYVAPPMPKPGQPTGPLA